MSISDSEDRKIFAEKVAQVSGEVAPNEAVYSVEEALAKAGHLGYPILVLSAYALGAHRLRPGADQGTSLGLVVIVWMIRSAEPFWAWL